MAHSKQARKRLRQDEKRRVRNKSLRHEVKTLTKSLDALVKEKQVEEAKALLSRVTSKLDKAANRNVFHANAAARRKAKAAKLVHEAAAAGAATEETGEGAGES